SQVIDAGLVPPPPRPFPTGVPMPPATLVTEHEPIARPQPLPGPVAHLTPHPAAIEKPARLVSLDAYRGFVMLAMVSGGFAFAKVAESFPADTLPGQGMHWLAYEFDHVPWVGCAFWDLIQPSFMFMVGVAMPFSYASRRAQGHSGWRNAVHVLWRSAVL